MRGPALASPAHRMGRANTLLRQMGGGRDECGACVPCCARFVSAPCCPPTPTPPAQHRYFDAVLNNSRGGVTVIKKAVCMHEEDAGMAWKVGGGGGVGLGWGPLHQVRPASLFSARQWPACCRCLTPPCRCLTAA
jgi:hypothetical protein